MTKDEILEKSRKENQNRDLYDIEVEKLAFTVSHLAFMFICFLAILLEFILTRKINPGYPMIYFGVQSIIFLVKYIKLRKFHELVIFICQFAVFALSLVAFILQLLGR